MGISGFRLKGTGTKQIYEDYVLTWSGVNMTTRATHGVGFSLHPVTAKNVFQTEFISERIKKKSSKRRTGHHSLHPGLRTL